MNRAKAFSLLTTMLTIPTGAFSAPSAPIANLINTPASVFDVFLINMHENARCYRDSGKIINDQPCMTTFRYLFNENIIEMSFFASQNVNELTQLTGKPRRDVESGIIEILKQVSQNVGVEPRASLGYSGWIQLTPIRNGWSTGNLNEDAAREEFKLRTRVHLHTDRLDGYRYHATRSIDGTLKIKGAPSSF